MKNVLKPLAKGILILASAADKAIRKKMFGSGLTTIMSNEEMIL